MKRLKKLKVPLVPKNLKIWFVIHCVLDVLFALPLLLIPVRFLSVLGWTEVDPLTARLAAAALFGIGLESFLGRNAGPESYHGMLRLKVIWSTVAVIGLVVSLLTLNTPPLAGWVFVGIFVLFNLVWVYWLLRIKKVVDA